MTTPGIPNNYTLSTTCFGARLGNIQDQIFAAVGMGFRRLELGLAESPPSMEGLLESQRETGVTELEPGRFVGRAPEQVLEFLEEELDPILERHRDLPDDPGHVRV